MTIPIDDSCPDCGEPCGNLSRGFCAAGGEEFGDEYDGDGGCGNPEFEQFGEVKT